MSEGYDVRADLAAVLVHIQANPGLEIGISEVSLPLADAPNLLPGVRVNCGDEEFALRQFLRWAESMSAVESIEIRGYAPQGKRAFVHLAARGQLISGATVEVSMGYRGQHEVPLRTAAGDAARVEVAEFARIIGAEAVAS